MTPLPTRPGSRGLPWLLLLLVPALLAAPRAPAQLPGLDSPQAIGAYLGGSLPSLTPGIGTGEWEVVDAFPNLTFLDPVYLLPEPAGSRLFVVGKPGMVYSFPNDSAAVPGAVKTVLDIRTKVRLGGDTGMVNMAFHPEYGQPSSPNRDYFYLWYRYTPNKAVSNGYATPAYIRLSRFTISQVTGVANPASELVLIQQYDRHDWHCGGGMFFGPDGFLYVTVGDEGGADDEFASSQKINASLFGGVLRIDVDRDPARSHPIRRQPQNPGTPPSGWPASFTANYYIPNDNPWVDPAGNNLEEFYAIGLRSPHTMSRDSQTGWVFIGDVGQGSREEISFLEAGANFQWPYREGGATGPATQPGNLIGADTPPIWDYARSSGGCVIGGLVYRGSQHAADLGGKYLFGDHNSRNIWTMTFAPGASPQVELIAQMPPTVREKGQLASFGTDQAGEVYMCKPDGTNQPGGKIYKLTRTGAPSPEPPALLSQTGAFANLATLTPAPGVIPYGVTAPLWSDGAIKRRWLVIPNDGTHDTPAEQIAFSQNGNWNFPAGSVFIKHFEIPLDERNPAGPMRRLETRFLVHGANGQYYGATYKWRQNHSDADLVAAEGVEEPVDIIDSAGLPRTIDWLYPGRGACTICHTPQAGRVLGLRTRQLGGDFFYLSTGRTANQLRTLNHLGIFTPALDPDSLSGYLASAPLDDSGASLQKRALSYIDSNCMHCHQPGGAAVASFDARLSTPPSSQGMIGGVPINDLGIPGAGIIKPQEIAASILYQRINSLGGCCPMPPLAKNRLDTAALAVVANWIQSLDPDAAPGDPTGVSGVAFDYYEGSYTLLPDFDNLTPLLNGTTAGFDLGSRLRNDEFAFRFRAKLFVETPGNYTFFTSSNDGSRLWIDDALVVDNDGLHGNVEASGAVAGLTAGFHDITVGFFDAFEDNLLTVSWAAGGIPKQPIPEQNLFLGEVDLGEPLALLSSETPVANGPFTVEVAFSEPVTGLTLADFALENATASNLTGSGAAYGLTLSPLENGEVRITLPADRVIDAVAHSNPPSNTLAVEVSSPTTRALFDAFLLSRGVTGTPGEAMGDPDGDGAPNLQEFAFGTNPSGGSDANPVLTAPATGAESGFFTFSFPALAGGAFAPDGSYTAFGVTYRPMASADLDNWDLLVAPAGSPPGLSVPPEGYVYLSLLLPSEESRAFVCVQIEAALDTDEFP